MRGFVSAQLCEAGRDAEMLGRVLADPLFLITPLKHEALSPLRITAVGVDMAESRLVPLSVEVLFQEIG